MHFDSLGLEVHPDFVLELGPSGLKPCSECRCPSNAPELSAEVV